MSRRIDLDRLSPAARARVERALAGPRDVQLCRRFPDASVKRWKKAAKAEGVTLTAWMQRALDGACGSQ